MTSGGGCVTGEGGDAYFVDLAGGSDSGVDYELLIGLSTLDDSVLGGDRKITPLPPDPGRFENASFRWLLTDGVRTTEITGGVVSLHPVSEPSTFIIAPLGFGLAAEAQEPQRLAWTPSTRRRMDQQHQSRFTTTHG